MLLARRPEDGKYLSEYLIQQGFVVELVLIDQTPDWLARLLVAPPGALVVDQEVASAQGWEILKMLKTSSSAQHIPVLFYSLAEEDDSGSLLELDYLIKPMGTKALIQALKRQGLMVREGDQEKTILIVDDEPGILEMHARAVEAQSPRYRVLKARNGREALEMIQHQLPDLVLLDLLMPELDGFGVRRNAS